uniref:Dehydrogenase/reductase SDR family member 11 n=1 Tax=Timema poppense TaxID=170557 RepID=A0A7R9HBM0_TIMPO|nr:unnamed protein product [Timema poppensis]
MLSASLKPILWDGGREDERRGVASQPTKVSFRANQNRWIMETVDGASYRTVSAKLASAMLRWSGRVAVVTGASSGIGRSIAEELVKKGLQVVGLARRLDRLEELRDEVQNAPGKLYPIKCDITSEEDILAAFEWTKEHLNGVDILVNNAGVGTIQTLIENTTSELRKILDVNVLGLSICTREAVKSMRERGVDDGHIININR